MDAPKTSLALRVARGVSVSMAVAAMVAFVVLEHRRLNRIEPVFLETSETSDDEMAGTVVPDIEIEESVTNSQETTDRPTFQFSTEVRRMELPAVTFDIPAESLVLPLPVLVTTPEYVPDPPPAPELLVYTSGAEVYMSSSKFAGPPPKVKRPKNSKQRP